MADIQSATAEIRRGKKERKKKPQGKNKMSASVTQGGHKHIPFPGVWLEEQAHLRTVCRCANETDGRSSRQVTGAPQAGDCGAGHVTSTCLSFTTSSSSTEYLHTVRCNNTPTHRYNARPYLVRSEYAYLLLLLLLLLLLTQII